MIEIEVKKAEPIEKAIRRFRKKVLKSGILKDVFERQFYIKKSERKHRRKRARK